MFFLERAITFGVFVYWADFEPSPQAISLSITTGRVGNYCALSPFRDFPIILVPACLRKIPKSTSASRRFRPRPLRRSAPRRRNPTRSPLPALASTRARDVRRQGLRAEALRQGPPRLRRRRGRLSPAARLRQKVRSLPRYHCYFSCLLRCLMLHARSLCFEIRNRAEMGRKCGLGPWNRGVRALGS
jgi:hypothetical protein